MCQCFVVNDITFVSRCIFCIFYRGACMKEIGSKINLGVQSESSDCPFYSMVNH